MRILVIKLGALGDFILCFGPFQGIREHHPQCHITLLTTGAYVELAEQTGFFDEILIDNRSKNPIEIFNLIKKLKDNSFDRIYDLQTAGRTSWYHTLLWPNQPEWSGIARNCSHPDDNPRRNYIHEIERRKIQLSKIGIDHVGNPDLSCLLKYAKDLHHDFNLPQNYGLIMPGASIHRQMKIWPIASFIQVASDLSDLGITPVIIGGKDEYKLAQSLLGEVSTAIDLTQQTSIPDLARLAQNAKIAVGGDTGPMHIFSLMDCPSILLYSDASVIEQSAHRGARVCIIQKSAINLIKPIEVNREIASILDNL